MKWDSTGRGGKEANGSDAHAVLGAKCVGALANFENFETFLNPVLQVDVGGCHRFVRLWARALKPGQEKKCLLKRCFCISVFLFLTCLPPYFAFRMR